MITDKVYIPTNQLLLALYPCVPCLSVFLSTIRLSVYSCVRSSVQPSVRLSVRPLVGLFGFPMGINRPSEVIVDLGN